MPDTCEILIAIVHLARGLTLISSPALILHRKWLPFPGDCQLIFTGLENSYCRSNTSSSSTPQVTCLEVQTRGPNSCTLLILDVQPGCNVTWSRHSNVARPAAPSCWWGIYLGAGKRPGFDSRTSFEPVTARSRRGAGQQYIKLSGIDLCNAGPENLWSTSILHFFSNRAVTFRKGGAINCPCNILGFICIH